MELRTFNKTIKRNQLPRSKVPFVTLNERGKFNFSQAARRLFAIEEGDRVLFHQDITYRQDWYIQFTKESNGYKLVFGETDTRITAAIVASEIFKSLGKQPQKLTFPVKANPLHKDGRLLYIIDFKNQI
jgi:hypothetical protein